MSVLSLRAGPLAVLRHQDVAAGLFFVALAACAFALALDMPAGRAARMGPGFYPRLVAILMTVIAIALLARGIWFRRADLVERLAIRPIASVAIAIRIFAAATLVLGLFATAVAATIATGLLSSEFRLGEGALIGTALGAFVSLVFVVALGLPLTVFPKF
jgi:hypothetical protein